MTEKQSPLEAIAEVAPKLTQLSRDVLFGDVWERPGLSKRDRGLVTVAVLAALARADQLAAHRSAHWTTGSPVTRLAS
jgi:4-carboxymuconolactone decarboxylase